MDCHHDDHCHDHCHDHHDCCCVGGFGNSGGHGYGGYGWIKSKITKTPSFVSLTPGKIKTNSGLVRSVKDSLPFVDMNRGVWHDATTNALPRFGGFTNDNHIHGNNAHFSDTANDYIGHGGPDVDILSSFRGFSGPYGHIHIRGNNIDYNHHHHAHKYHSGSPHNNRGPWNFGKNNFGDDFGENNIDSHDHGTFYSRSNTGKLRNQNNGKRGKLLRKLIPQPHLFMTKTGL